MKIHIFTVKEVKNQFFKYIFNISLVIIEISMACDLSFQAISFQDLYDPRGVIFQIFYRTYEREVVNIDITMACDISILCVFFSTKTMGMIKNPF